MSTNIYKNEIKCAVFDLDGTLLNTIKTITHYLNFALEKNGFSTVNESRCATFVGDGVRMLICRALNEVGGYSDEAFRCVSADYNSAYDERPDFLTEAYEGVPEMLVSLKESGVRLAVLSNKPHIATVGTVKSFFPSLFDTVSGGRAGVPLKPDPTSLLDTISALGCTPEECAYIGDSDVDMITASRAGVALSIGVTWGYRSREVLTVAGAEQLADTPSDVLRLIFTKNT